MLGDRRLTEITRRDLQDLVDAMVAEGHKPSTIVVTMTALGVIFKRALSRDEISVNPTLRVEPPAVRGGRDRVASPRQCEALLAALPAGDRALWATAMYAGLRRGELTALRIETSTLAAA